MSETAEKASLGGSMSAEGPANMKFRQLMGLRALIPTLNATAAEVKDVIHEALRAPLKECERNKICCFFLPFLYSFLA